MSIFKGSLIVIFGSLGIKAALLLKDILVSQKFGIGPELSLFLSAFLIPSIISNQLGLCFQVINTPTILENSNKLNLIDFRRIILHQFYITALFYVVLFSGFRWIFPQMDSNENLNYYFILALTIPYFFLMPIRTLLGQILYINNYHLSNFLLAFISPLIIIFFLINISKPEPIFLGFSLTASSVVEFLGTYIYLRRKKLFTTNEERKLKLELSDLIPAFTLQILISSNLLIDQIFASRFGDDFLSVFNYSSKIPGIIGTTSMVLASSVFLPAFQKLKLENKKIKIKKELAFLGLLGVFLGTLLSYKYSFEITKYIYQRGNFGSNATIRVAAVQAYYFLMAPLNTLFLTFIRYLNAINQNNQAMQYGLLSFISIWISNVVFLKLEIPNFIPFSVIFGYGIILIVQLFKKSRNNENTSSYT